ncbi:MAG: aromatic ring-opening dioxygenase [Sphingobium sp.]|nr:aromatic ring-opening dioxygenase [Sphingobium sp.]
MTDHNQPFDEHDDQAWADILSPSRRNMLLGGGVAALAGVGLAGNAFAQQQDGGIIRPDFWPDIKREPGKSPWGYETYKEPAKRPVSVRPGEQILPTQPRKYTDIKSYHAHVYFDEDSYHKAELLRKWTVERFPVELGHWNYEPVGPHVTPSFYFGFENDIAPVVIPWLQLNSLGLTILLHPNTEDPRADHLYYALWVNRAQPVNAYNMKKPAPGQPPVEQIFINTKPTVKVEA